jgi:hypothetical protein
MKRVGMIVALAVLLAAGGAPFRAAPAPGPKPPKPVLALELEARKTKMGAEERVAFTITLVNRSKNAVTLVEPGDGSECGWRTPRVWWSVVEVTRPGTPLRGQGGGRCGNINGLKPQEVFTLRPGEAKRLSDWVCAPALTSPGTYRVAMFYENVPALRWKGLGVHDAATLIRVQNSFPCLLKSNEVTITLAPAAK